MTAGFFAQVIVSGLMLGAIYALIAQGYNIVFGATGGISFAQGEYLTLSGFTSISLASIGVPLPIAVVAAIALATLVSVVLERATIHPVIARGAMAIGIVTIGQQIALQTTELTIWGYGSQSLPPFTDIPPLRMFGAVVQPQTFWVFGGTALVFVFLACSTHGLG